MNAHDRALDPVARGILDAALAEFANYGFAGARIDAIVARTKTSKRMVYYHFGGKEGLYTATLEYAYRKVSPDAVSARLDALPPLEALETFACSAFDQFCKTPDFIRLALQENLQGGRYYEKSPALRKMNRERLGVVERIVERGWADGSMRDDVSALDVYINFVGLCAYHISARHSYEAFFDLDWSDPEVMRARRKSICDAIVRYVRRLDGKSALAQPGDDRAGRRLDRALVAVPRVPSER